MTVQPIVLHQLVLINFSAAGLENDSCNWLCNGTETIKVITHIPKTIISKSPVATFFSV